MQHDENEETETMPDDNLRQFEAQGAAPLPVPTESGDGRGFEADYREGYVEHEAHGSGTPATGTTVLLARP